VDVDEKPKTLGYATPESKLPTDFDDLVTGLFVGRLRSKWFYYQLGYYLALGLLFWVIAFELGVNYFRFGKLARQTPADYVADVRQYCLPVVRAMKEFQRDHGRLPNDMDELIPGYLPDQSDKAVQLFGARQGQFERPVAIHHRIQYDFTPGNEGWIVVGPDTNGRIPLPPVTIAPASRPTTQKN